MPNLVLIRHGQSQWNLENRFTGWKDVDLTEAGKQEAQAAGVLLKKEGFQFDVAYTSVLKRAIRTLWIVLDELDLMWIPVNRSWKLNERHYGALQGLNKAETREKYGDAQVHEWRRGYRTMPPALTPDDERFPGHDQRYQSLNTKELPLSESLEKTVERVLPYWKTEISPNLQTSRSVLVVAHGNSLRALVKILDQISDEEIPELNIPTGVPLVYDLDENNRPVNRRFLGDPDQIKKLQKEVKNQTKSS